MFNITELSKKILIEWHYIVIMLHDVISRPVIAVVAVTRLLPVAAHN